MMRVRLTSDVCRVHWAYKSRLGRLKLAELTHVTLYSDVHHFQGQRSTLIVADVLNIQHDGTVLPPGE